MVVRVVAAVEGETVQIIWTCADGELWVENYTVPPPAVRKKREPKPAILGKQIDA